MIMFNRKRKATKKRSLSWTSIDSFGDGKPLPEAVPEESFTGEDPTVAEGGSELEALRRLLLAPEHSELTDLRRNVEELRGREDHLTVEEVSETLPEAIALRARQDNKLAKALAPTIEDTLKVSIERDPQPMADAIFPIIGPAIRKSIAEAMTAVVQSVNTAIDHSLSIQSLKWRFEARRTGRSFAEVVLANTLQYRVEQIFLIDRLTGLPLQHLVNEGVVEQDGAIVSSMLTAIQDFIKDSFGASSEDTVNTLQVGDLTVWIEQGPKALVAAVIRGVPAAEVRLFLKDIIETIHLEFRDALRNFRGDATPFEGAAPILEQGLVSQIKVKEKKRRWFLVASVAAALIALSVWAFLTMRENRWWRDYVATLDAQPGIIVTEAGWGDGAWYVNGLRDPLATEPNQLLQQTRLDPSKVTHNWEPYQTLEANILMQRITQFLAPPETVTLSFDNGTLTAVGIAEPDWIETARFRVPFLVGVNAYNDSQVQDAVWLRISSLDEQIEGTTFHFVAGSARFLEDPVEVQQALIQALADLAEAASIKNQDVQLEVEGHASSEGSDRRNIIVSQQRADAVKRLIEAADIPGLSVVARGTGTENKPFEEVTEEDRRRNRRVSFRVSVVAP